MVSYKGKSSGFAQQFCPPVPSPFLQEFVPLCGKYRRSEVTLSLIRDDILRFHNSTEKPKDRVLDEAMRKTIRAFLLPEPVPLRHLNDVFNDKSLPIWSSSPGLPWTQLGYRNKAAIRNDVDAIQRVRWFWHKIKNFEEVSLPDCCAYVRAQIVEEGETKARAVWGYPATVTFGEAVFALPLIKAYQSGRYPIAYGYETGNGGMRKLADNFNGAFYLGIDFKNFDKTVPSWMIEFAFDVLAFNLDFRRYEEYGTARVDSMLHMFDVIRDYCINTTIRMCNGERYQKSSGIASGSYFTQLVGSIINYLLLTYASLKTETIIKNIKVLGDDSICALESLMTPGDVAQVLSPLGLIVNVQKSGFSRYLQGLTFLGYEFDACTPRKDRQKTFAGLIYPERPDRTWDDVASRALGILYANLGVDPTVDFLCRELCSHPFNLSLTRDQERYLRMLGFGDVSTIELPDWRVFAKRLRLC